MSIDTRILVAISAEGGAFAADLEKIAPDFATQLEQLPAIGLRAIRSDSPAGPFYRLEGTSTVPGASPEEDEDDTGTSLDAPPSIRPPAEAPRAEELVPVAPAYIERPQTQRLQIISREIRLQTRIGAPTKITIVPSTAAESAAVITWAAGIPEGSSVIVELRIAEGIPAPMAPDGPSQPKPGTITPAQLRTQLDELEREGKLPGGLASAMGNLIGSG